MRIRVDELRRVIRESLLIEAEIPVEGESRKNSFFDSSEGKKWINSLSTGAASIDEVLRTKFELMIKNFENRRTSEAVDVAASIEQHIKAQETSFSKKMELYHHWREGLKMFIKKFKETTAANIGSAKIKSAIAPHMAQPGPETNQSRDWSKELSQ